MIEWAERILRVNLRVVLLTLVFLLLFDAALDKLILPYYMSSGGGTALSGGADVPAIRRLPADDLNTLQLWKDQMVQDQGIKVVFLGDSIVFGGGVPAENQTIPAYFSRQLNILLPRQDIKVYNFSLRGCTPADTLNILNFIIDAGPDLVIYDENIGWFGSSRIMEHPRLAELPSGSKPTKTSKAEPRQEKKTEVLESVLTDWMNDHWALYRNRIFLNYLWFGKPLKEILVVQTQPQGVDQDAAQLLEEEELYKPWYLKNFDALKKTKGKLGYCTLNDTNQHWVIYNRLMKKLQDEKIPAVTFMIPRNRTLYVKYDLLDEPFLMKQQAILTEAATSRGVKVYDYTFAVTDRFFTDSVHMTREGNQIIGERLAIDIVRDKIVK